MKDKYFIFSVDWFATILGIILGIVGGGFSSFLTDQDSVLLTTGVGILVALCTHMIVSSWRIRAKLEKADNYKIRENLFHAIDKIIHDVDNSDKAMREKQLRKWEYYLTVINEHIGSAFEFQPDIAPITTLHKVDGTISVTAKAPHEWLNPTYNFFLVKHYLVSLKHQVNSRIGHKTVEFSSSREAGTFIGFTSRKKKIVEELSRLGDEGQPNLKEYLEREKICVRFFFLSSEEIQKNRPILETLIAGHELFGCYLYIVIGDPLSRVAQNTLADIGYNRDENNNKIDLMITPLNGKISVIHKYEERLRTSELISDHELGNAQAYIKAIGEHVYANYENAEKVFDHVKRGFTVNNQYPHTFIENHE